MGADSRGATVRRSRELADGSWETIELSITQAGTADPFAGEGPFPTGTPDVQLAAALAQELDAAILSMFLVRDRAKAKAYKEAGARLDQEAKQAKPPWWEANSSDGPACPEHGVAWQTRRKGERSWRSHPVSGGDWCNDPSSWA